MLVLIALALVAGLIGVAVVVGGRSERSDDPASRQAGSPSTTPVPSAPPAASETPTSQPDPRATRAARIFDDNRFLVAYYGTAGTGALGVLGETDPDTAHRRLMRAARAFIRPNQPVQAVYELIVTIADAHPGKNGDYNHDIDRAAVQRYIDAAHRNGALVVLDLQPGRANFLDVAKRWEWALRDPFVGLALDPEWRMGPREVPGRVIGSVDAAEVNAVTRWLADLQERHDLPQKLFLLHQFRDDMITRIGSVQPRPSLAMVQHVDGFGTPGQKLATFAHVAHPPRFRMGFKLFYDEDVDLMNSTEVHRIRPKVRFVSFQ
ncbi:hypothetical protein [Nocardioides sp. R-C-SC26]|uniref:hypothetical protein n=1 Tax=Nocardioides sp. R-C-SC26 TaxID=2870414 RepID=UPI001E2836E1|nr:hypothetical protein [Nocardioides sp. R-C-SC26]